jgi:UTP:GlnB (protein PII) uridylyltransferase
VGIGAAGAEVHAARVTTDNGQAVDRFELTDGEGRKLDDAAKEAIRRALADGVAPSRTRRRKRVVTGSRQEGEAGRSSTRSDEETLRP